VTDADRHHDIEPKLRCWGICRITPMPNTTSRGCWTNWPSGTRGSLNTHGGAVRDSLSAILSLNSAKRNCLIPGCPVMRTAIGPR
jgi:hypothetical protein